MPPRFVVTRANWRRLPGGVFRLPGRVDVSIFDSFTEADATRAELEARLRTRVNPATWGDALYDVSRLPIHPLTDFLLEAGLEPPGPTVNRRGWAAWWAATYRTLSPELADAAWRAFDLLSPNYLVEDRPGSLLFTQAAVVWLSGLSEYDDGIQRATTEARRVRLFCRSWSQVKLGGWVEHDRYPDWRYDVGGHEAFERNPVEPRPEPFVVPFGTAGFGIPADYIDAAVWHGSSAIPARVAVVFRLGWQSSGENRFRFWQGFDAEDPPLGCPVAAFPDRAAAEADAWARDVDARRYLNPFRFGPPTTLSSVGEVGFRAVLADFGLDLPNVLWDWTPEVQAAWVRWWEVTAGRLSVDQRETAWNLFDRLRFHAVAELPVRG